MNKLTVLSFLFSIINLLADSDKNKLETFEEIHKEFKRIDQMFDQHRNAMHDKMSKLFNEFKDSKEENGLSIDAKEEGDNVVVTLKSSKFDFKENEIEVEAKGNKLQGKLPYNGQTLKFYVKNGILFGASLTYEKKEEEIKKEQKDSKDKEQKDENNVNKVEYIYSSSSNVITLPYNVSNLEEATVVPTEEGLKIILPKSSSKKGWKKIKVGQEQK